MSTLEQGTLADLVKLTQLNISTRQNLQQPIPTGRESTTLAVPYPWGAYPIGHMPYDQVGAIALPAVGTTSDVTFSPEFIVPSGYDGVITFYSINFMGGGFDQASGAIVWQILRNGQPIRNFESITSERGTFATPSPLPSIRIYSGDKIQVTANHVANAALNGQVLARFIGYYYPQAR